MTTKKLGKGSTPSNRPLIDPLADSLTVFSDAERAAAMEQFRVLQPHLRSVSR